MITDPVQATEPPTVPTAPDPIQAPAAATVPTVPALIPAAVEAELPQRIEGTDYAFLGTYYDVIPILRDANGNLQIIPQAQLPLFPSLPYADTLHEAETNMHAVMQYHLTHNIRSENMPAAWASKQGS